MAEHKRNTMSLDELLADADRRLRDVDERILGTSDDHVLGIVVRLQALLRALTRCIARQIQLAFDQALQELANFILRTRRAGSVDAVRNRQTKSLLSSPQRLRLEVAGTAPSHPIQGPAEGCFGPRSSRGRYRVG